MIFNAALKNNDYSPSKGIYLVADVKNATLQHALQLTPEYLKKMIHIFLDCYRVKLKSIDIVNLPTVMKVVVDTTKSSLSKKLKTKIFAHTTSKILAKKFPKNILPTQYGGTDGSTEDLTGIFIVAIICIICWKNYIFVVIIIK